MGKALATKPDNLGLIFRPHLLGREVTPESCAMAFTCAPQHILIRVHTQIHK